MSEELITMMDCYVQSLMNKLDTIPYGSEEYAAIRSELSVLSGRLLEARKDELEAKDREERRKIEIERNRTMAEIERNKQKIGWERWAFELMKMGITIGTGMYSFFKAQQNVLKFEETGRFTSFAGRELHLPKITWWK